VKEKGIPQKARRLRSHGCSFREISEFLGISKSTASLWTREVRLSPKASSRLAKLQETGRKRSEKAREKKKLNIEKIIAQKSRETVKNVKLNIRHYKIICALIYWCEGGKNDGGRVSFSNSDPKLIKYFLRIFRKSFDLEENKFRALLHIHDYHNEKKQIQFWSKITKIPIEQFSRSFHKKNTGKNIRVGYPGCLNVRYSNSIIQKELVFICKEIFNK